MIYANYSYILVIFSIKVYLTITNSITYIGSKATIISIIKGF